VFQLQYGHLMFGYKKNFLLLARVLQEKHRKHKKVLFEILFVLPAFEVKISLNQSL